MRIILTVLSASLFLGGLQAQAQQYWASSCPPGLKDAAGACVRECPAGYEDRGRTCVYRNQSH